MFFTRPLSHRLELERGGLYRLADYGMVPHRHRLPLMAPSIGPSWRRVSVQEKEAPCMIWPMAGSPHCATCSRSWPLGRMAHGGVPNPSIVVISPLRHWQPGGGQARNRDPVHMTVQGPHCCDAQPILWTRDAQDIAQDHKHRMSSSDVNIQWITAIHRKFHALSAPRCTLINTSGKPSVNPLVRSPFPLRQKHDGLWGC